MDYNVSELRARLESAVAVDAPARPERMTVALLASMYIAHAEKEYNGQHGHKELATIRHAVSPLIMLYSDDPPSAIGPLQLRAARHLWIEQRLARTTIQARMQRLRKMWRWGRQVGLIETDLPDIGALRYGHTKEPDPVKPVDLSLVELTLPHLSKGARAIIRLLMYTGMRPGEAYAMRADEIDTSVNPWVFRPRHHKTAWKGCKREIYLGPKAQMLLQSLLHGGRATAAADTAMIANATTMSARVANDAPSIVDATRGPLIFLTARGQPWKPTSLYMQVWNATRRHGLPHWAPGQIRHTFATEARKRFGRDAAQVLLGHSRPTMTDRYAEPHRESAIEAARMIG